MCLSTEEKTTSEQALERLAKLIGPAFIVSVSGAAQSFPTVRTKLDNLKEILIDNWDELRRLANIVHNYEVSEAGKIRSAMNIVAHENTARDVAVMLAKGARSPELDLLVETYRKKGKVSG